MERNLCLKCEDGAYQMENDALNNGEYINCYKELKGYYLDKNDSLYKKVFTLVKYVKKKEIILIIIVLNVILIFLFQLILLIILIVMRIVIIIIILIWKIIIIVLLIHLVQMIIHY